MLRMDQMRERISKTLSVGKIIRMVINGESRDAIVAGIYPHHVLFLYQPKGSKRVWIRTSFTWYDLATKYGMGGYKIHEN